MATRIKEGSIDKGTRMADRYLKYIDWSDEDGVYIGHCPELGFRIHREDNNKVKLYKDLCDIVESHVEEELNSENGFLPEPTLLEKNYSGKFVLRTDKDFHRRLTLEASKSGLSLNKFVGKLLKDSR